MLTTNFEGKFTGLGGKTSICSHVVKSLDPISTLKLNYLIAKYLRSFLFLLNVSFNFTSSKDCYALHCLQINLFMHSDQKQYDSKFSLHGKLKSYLKVKQTDLFLIKVNYRRQTFH